MLRIRKFESGQVVALVAGAIFVIIAIAALAVDIGSLYATRRNMQTAADAAAIAGANALQTACGTSSSCSCNSESSCESAGAEVAKLNGYINGGANSTSVSVVTPSTPPTNPVGGIFVQASVSEAVPTYFMRAVGFSTVTVGATAIAGYATSTNCVYIKNPGDVAKTLTVSGGAELKANCGILDESTSSDGMDVSGGSSEVSGTTVGVVASSYSGSSGGASVTCSGSTTNCPATGVAATPDPLAYLDSDEPTPGACVTGANETTATSGNGGTIGPGTYCSGIKVGGGHTITLTSGLYILTGSNGLNVSGTSTIDGTNVTIYNSGTGKVDISGGSTANLTAPGTGQAGLPGILFFQDPSNTAAATFSGGSTGNVEGALYFPTTTMLTFSGGSSSAPENVELDAWEVTFSGGSTFLGAAASGSGSAPPITTSRLYQ